MTVAVSLTAPQFDRRPDALLDAAATVESCGYSGLFLFDHLVPIGDASRPVLELAATLGALAASTSAITVGTLVIRAPLRGPAVSAAIAATAAAIAPRRVVIGVGAGDSKSADEASRFGLPTRPLGQRIADVRETLRLTAGSGVERWVGGVHDRLLGLVGEADGWNGWAIEPARLESIVERLRASSHEPVISWGGSVVMGGDAAELDRILGERNGRGGTITGTADEVVRSVEALAAAGATHLVLSILPNRRRSWESFAELVLPRLT